MTVRVFVACTEAERLPMRVLEFSIRETTSLPVRVTAIQDAGREIPRPRDLRNQPRTPFSFQRFLIPELCEWRGRAIYMDADMQVFRDVGEVWNAPMQDHDLLAVHEAGDGRKGQFSVMLLDCERLGWRVEEVVAGLDEGRYSYEQLMGEMCVARRIGRTLGPEWNSLEAHEPGRTGLLHYTNMVTQPWVSLGNPLGELWVDCLRRAIHAGFVRLDDLRRAVAEGHVRPSLLLEATGEETVPARLRALDAGFVPPYKALRSGSASPWLSWRARGADYARRVLHRLRAL